ncbi:MAG: cobyrinate a,c-diamide synthase [Oscillatoriaceae bacterium SKW80]|nr:cobyrinate a,c-diamide synthase [Oscillatoriaceae bacterium SKYG93]MCX8120602.1 cobyrinate a,c-diamide synthase [Oscillatoriaceae bacterium SKW80]MDW8453859.1 cobyrinate a,c-diamide synthase [Oscillatoriaceae cyanobacterium SKYGB_i_bin93]HIK27090.1 cobyrinate a,c-diamide synthase [Oscillatoriaceae cyanobacterium M7585_C2015_266]
MALVIAGDRSETGKTTITLALLAYLKQRGFSVQSFKVGPDYIDPMFHHYITARPCRNLDPLLTSEKYIQECFARHAAEAEFALVEGVMGLFDGVSNKTFYPESEARLQLKTDFASTAHVARLLNLPVVLVIDCSRLSGSVAAIASGYSSLDPTINLAGVVLNRVGSARHRELLLEALEPLQLPVLGVLRRQDNITIPNRHLGLIPTAELPNLKELLDKLACIAAECFDWQRLLPLLRIGTLPKLPQTEEEELQKKGDTIRIAIARDAAFNFYYQDNLDALESLGAELIFWSPLTDTHLPENVQGLYFGGGFPEIFAAELSNNIAARSAVHSAIQAGMPTYAECGGLMYLCEKLVDFQGQVHAMTGILPTTAVMSDRLILGYRQATALQNTPLLLSGTTIWGHEFHRSHLTKSPPNPLYQTWGLAKQNSPIGEGWQLYQLHASYIHLHWGARLEIPARFLQHCADFHTSSKNHSMIN